MEEEAQRLLDPAVSADTRRKRPSESTTPSAYEFTEAEATRRGPTKSTFKHYLSNIQMLIFESQLSAA